MAIMSNLRERAEEAFKIEKKRADDELIAHHIEQEKKNAQKLTKELATVLGEKISPAGNEAIIDDIKFSMQDGYLVASIECPACKIPAWRPISSLVDVGILLNNPSNYHVCPKDLENERYEMMRNSISPHKIDDGTLGQMEEKPKTLWQKIVGAQ
jgi:hypothetical protein